MSFWNKKQVKKDPRKVASALRGAIAGKELVKEPLKGFDLSSLSTDQLQRLWEIQTSDLSKEEKCAEVEKMLNTVNGVEKVTGMTFVHNGESIEMGPKAKPGFHWFNGDDKHDDGMRRPKWFAADNETELPGVTPKPEPPKRTIVQKVHDFFSHHDEVEQAPVVEMKQSGKEILQEKMKQIEDQMEVDLELRNKSRAYMKMQEYL